MKDGSSETQQQMVFDSEEGGLLRRSHNGDRLLDLAKVLESALRRIRQVQTQPWVTAGLVAAKRARLHLPPFQGGYCSRRHILIFLLLLIATTGVSSLHNSAYLIDTDGASVGISDSNQFSLLRQISAENQIPAPWTLIGILATQIL